MKIHRLTIFLFPQEELHCGYGKQQGNVLPSHPHIPGRVLRGGLAGWAIRNGRVSGASDPLFEKLFIPVVKEEDDFNFSFPFCRVSGFQPAPLSLFQVKGRGLDPETTLFMPNEKPFISDHPDSPIDFLRREMEWPSDRDPSLKPLANKMVDQMGRLASALQPLIDLKNSHEERIGRVGEKGLFAEEALPPSSSLYPIRHFYSGDLYFEERPEVTELFFPLMVELLSEPNSMGETGLSRLSALLDSPDQKHIIFLGHRRSPVVGYIVDKGVINTEKTELPFESLFDGKKFTLTLLTDLIPKREPYFPLTSRMLEEVTGLTGLIKKRIFCGKGVAHGFDVLANRAIDPVRTIVAGSCGSFEFRDASQEGYLRSLWGLSLLGVGRRSQEGYGRFKINWDIHRVVPEKEVS